MKTTKFCLLFLSVMIGLPLSLTSCSNDDEGLKTSSDLVGTWVSTYCLSEERYYDSDGKLLESDDFTDNDWDEAISFKEDNSWKLAYYHDNLNKWYVEEKGSWILYNGILSMESSSSNLLNNYDDGTHKKEVTIATKGSKLSIEIFDYYYYKDGSYDKDRTYTEYKKVSDDPEYYGF